MLRTFFMTFTCFFFIFVGSDVLLGLSCSNSKDSEEVSRNTQTPTGWEQEVVELDKQITELKEMKLGYESKAVRHINQAQRLQFVQGEQLTAKRYWELAEENKQIAEHIQKDIDELEAQKKSILDKHGVKPAVKESE